MNFLLFVASNKVELKFFFYMQTGLFCVLFYILLYSRRELEGVKCTWAGNTLWVCYHWLQIRARSSVKVRGDLESVLCPSCGIWCRSAPTTSHRDTSWERGLADKNVRGLICSMNCDLCHIPELIKYKPWSSASSWSPFQSHHRISSFKFSFPKLLSL